MPAVPLERGVTALEEHERARLRQHETFAVRANGAAGVADPRHGAPDRMRLRNRVAVADQGDVPLAGAFGRDVHGLRARPRGTARFAGEHRTDLLETRAHLVPEPAVAVTDRSA